MRKTCQAGQLKLRARAWRRRLTTGQNAAIDHGCRATRLIWRGLMLCSIASEAKKPGSSFSMSGYPVILSGAVSVIWTVNYLRRYRVSN